MCSFPCRNLSEYLSRKSTVFAESKRKMQSTIGFAVKNSVSKFEQISTGKVSISVNPYMSTANMIGRVNTMKVYVEKIDLNEGFLLLDFIYREDYEIFCEKIEHPDSKNDPRTILSIDGLWCSGRTFPKEHTVYIIPEQFLSSSLWRKEPGFFENEYMEEIWFSNVISFRAFFDYRDPFFGPPVTAEIYPKKNEQGSYYTLKVDGDLPLRSGKGKEKKHDIKVIVRNVGQGNWNEIYCDNQCKVVYDIGGSIHATNRDIKKWVNTSKAFNYHPILIISHWDVDHYLSLFEVSQETLNNMGFIFVPSKRISLTSQRAFHLLERNCSYLFVVPEPLSRNIPRKISLRPVYTGPNYAFFVGEHSSDINKSGLTLAIWNETSCVLLTGDHTYSQVFSDMCSCIPQNLRINMVTPHHGGKTGKITNPTTNLTFGTAMTSTGKNSYGHPFSQTRDDLTKMGFRWIRTDYENTDIEFNL